MASTHFLKKKVGTQFTVDGDYTIVTEKVKCERAPKIKQPTKAEVKAERSKRPPVVLTVKHQPTYACLSYKRADGLKENRKPPAAFTTKNEIQSIKSQTRLKNAVNWMLLFADKKNVRQKLITDDGNVYYKNWKFRLAFITLTLSDQQKHTDEFIKEHLLQPFLYWLSRYYQALYVWKAETQLNGNIHFHLTIDTFVPWKSIRAKWNSLLAKHGYCKIMQDGSNDKGDAATSIKSVLSETKCANDIAGYMSKKDEVSKHIQKCFEEFEKGNWTYHETIKKAFSVITHHKIKKATEGEMMDVVKHNFKTANVHCKFNPDLLPEKQDQKMYRRVINGRLWGCSQSLSTVEIFIDEHEPTFQKEEKIFFHQNSDIYNLGKNIIAREKEKVSKIPNRDREILFITDEDIEKKYRFMENVFIHKHLSAMKKGGTLQRLIHEEKLKRKKNFQKYFTEN